MHCFTSSFITLLPLLLSFPPFPASGLPPGYNGRCLVLLCCCLASLTPCFSPSFPCLLSVPASLFPCSLLLLPILLSLLLPSGLSFPIVFAASSHPPSLHPGIYLPTSFLLTSVLSASFLPASFFRLPSLPCFSGPSIFFSRYLLTYFHAFILLPVLLLCFCQHHPSRRPTPSGRTVMTSDE